MELHLVIVQLSHATKTFQFVYWQEADFIAQAAKKFGHKYVWWYRTAPDRPWLDRHRVGVTRKELDDPESPFGRAAVDRYAASGLGKSEHSARVLPATGKRSPTSGPAPSSETGPGLEKP